MVWLKYPAIYSDNFGCDKCAVLLSDHNLKLKVRGFNFYSEDYYFDFYAENKTEAKKFFYLKDNELIEYILDIRIKIPIINKEKKHIKKAILRIEREKNSYNNKLIVEQQEQSYVVSGSDFKNILFNLKKYLPEGYDIKLDMEYLFNS